ncbi:MAG: FkbM family methyltransferase [Pseudomonadota bacterium]
MARRKLSDYCRQFVDVPDPKMRDLRHFCAYVKERGFAPGTVIDVGFCYGTPELQEAFPDAYHMLFEPQKSLEKHMKNVLKRRRGEYHVCALSDQSGEMSMNIPPDAIDGASLAWPDAKHAQMVPVRTLDEVVGDRDLDGPVFLKTDCQGFDLTVLKGAENFLPKIGVVVMEVELYYPANNRDLYDFGDVVSWMRDRDFAVIDVLSYNKRPRDGALAYVDLAFAPNNGLFREAHSWL